MAFRIPEQPTHTSAQFDLAVGHASQALHELGQRARVGGTLELLGRDPQTLTSWARSRRRTPEAVEEKLYATAVLALIPVATFLNYEHTGPPAARGLPLGAAGAAAPAPVPFLAGPAPQVARRRAAAALPLAVRAVQPEPWYTLASLAVLRVWRYAPVLVSVLFVVLGLFFFRHPDAFLFVPVCVAGWVWNYVQFALCRLMARVDSEIHRLLFGLPLPANQVAPVADVVPPNVVWPQQPAAPGYLGWMIAASLYLWRQHN